MHPQREGIALLALHYHHRFVALDELGKLPLSPRLPQLLDSAQHLRHFALQRARRFGVQGGVAAGGAAAEVVGWCQSVTARGDGFAPATGGAAVVNGGRAYGHGLVHSLQS